MSFLQISERGFVNTEDISALYDDIIDQPTLFEFLTGRMARAVQVELTIELRTGEWHVVSEEFENDVMRWFLDRIDEEQRGKE